MIPCSRVAIASLLIAISFWKSACAAPIEAFTPPQYVISVDDAGKSLVTIAVPIATLEVGAIAAITDGFAGQQFNPRLMSLNFRGVSEGARNLELYVDIDSDVARCEVWVRFALPAARPEQLLVQDIGSDANCRSSLPPVLNLPQRLQTAALDGIRSALGKALLGDSAIADWIKDDAAWASLMTQAIAQGNYCTKRRISSLCINIAWLNRARLKEWTQVLKTSAPTSQGQANRTDAAAKRDAFVTAAKGRTLKPSVKFPGYSYPAPLKHGTTVFVDDDMGIFGGLLCSAGLSEGCELVAKAQGPDGRFWRAPDQVGLLDPDYSSFSGDQFNGIAAYLWLSNDKMKFESYLNYILSARQHLPSAARSLYAAYKSCRDDKAFQCALTGPEWMWLNLLASKYGLSGKIPQPESNPANLFGFDVNAMYWQAALAPAGYRLHLTGVQVLLARMMGAGSSAHNEVAAILAGRQPENPFFQFLLLGKDQRVMTTLTNQCPDPSSRASFNDWAWQRAESKDAWKESMIWDCAFLYSLIAQ